jgi:D-alanyl-D-alanine dipeptidase
MGTRFDDFRETANTAYYEKPGLNEEIRNNRRLLYHTMLKAGFSNLPTEWWHYDYGTKFWAHFTGNTALYEGILER